MLRNFSANTRVARAMALRSMTMGSMLTDLRVILLITSWASAVDASSTTSRFRSEAGGTMSPRAPLP